MSGSKANGIKIAKTGLHQIPNTVFQLFTNDIIIIKYSTGMFSGRMSTV